MRRLHLAALGVRVVCRVVTSWEMTLVVHGKPPMGARWLLSTWRRGKR